jgi:hypothetical protein
MQVYIVCTEWLVSTYMLPLKKDARAETLIARLLSSAKGNMKK